MYIQKKWIIWFENSHHSPKKTSRPQLSQASLFVFFISHPFVLVFLKKCAFSTNIFPTLGFSYGLVLFRLFSPSHRSKTLNLNYICMWVGTRFSCTMPTFVNRGQIQGIHWPKFLCQNSECIVKVDWIPFTKETIILFSKSSQKRRGGK